MEENDKLEQESDDIKKSDDESTSEYKAEVVDSAVSQTEAKKNADTEKAESSGEVVEEVSGEAKEAEVVEEVKASEDNEYAEVSVEKKVNEEITEEAESEDTEESVVSEENNTSEDNREAVEPEIEEAKEASNEVVEDADITEKESSEQSIEEAAVVEKDSEVNPKEDTSEAKAEIPVENESPEQKVVETAVIEEKSSEHNSEETSVEEIIEEIIIIEETQEHSVAPIKPKAVLDELDKLKTVKVESGTAELKTDEKKEPEKTESKDSQATEGNKVESVVSAVPSDSDDSSEEFDFKNVFNKDFWKSFLFDIFFLALCVWFTFMLIQKWFSTREVIIQGTSQVHSSLESGEKTTIGNINILVMGIDSVEGTHRSDTIFVLGVNPSKKKIMMLSIPRDTKVDIEGKSRKINEILPRYGEPTLRMLLEDLLKIRISRKVEIGFESFISVVDAIGGVDINIEKPMHYDDNWGNLHIHFNPGMNHLDGENALRYVRFRKDAMADLGRIKRQQEFVKAVIKKLFSPVTIVRVPSIVETAFKYIKTDFTLQEIMTLAKGFDTFDVKFNTLSLPGEARYIDKISFFIPNLDETIAIGNNYFSDLAIIEIEKECDLGKVIPKQSKTNRKK